MNLSSWLPVRFTTSVYDLTENMTIDYSELDSFVIYICMEGTCTVTDGDGNSLELQAGESILFPATTKEVKVTVEGHVKFLETYVSRFVLFLIK